MAPSKTGSPNRRNITTGTGLSGQSITGIDVWFHGIVTVIEITTSTGTQYIKVRQGVVEYGGTPDWDSGTKA
jgi:hypothetical protein